MVFDLLGLLAWSSSLVYSWVAHNPLVSRNMSAIQASCCHEAIEKLPALCCDRGHHTTNCSGWLMRLRRITEAQSVQVLFVFGWWRSYCKGLTKHVECFNASYGHCSSIRVFVLRIISNQHYAKSSKPVGYQRWASWTIMITHHD